MVPEVLVRPSEAWLTFSANLPMLSLPRSCTPEFIDETHDPSLGPAAVNEDTPEREGA